MLTTLASLASISPSNFMLVLFLIAVLLALASILGVQNPNEQVSSVTATARLRYNATRIQAKNFAANLGTLAPLTPITFNTSTGFWTTLASGGANGTGTLQGFVGPDPIVTHATQNVLGNVIIGGQIHLDDIPIIAGYTLAQLKVILNSDARSKGFEIQGLPDFR